MLDEYQARYGVRGCYRHLCYLEDLLDRAEKGQMIDPTLIHYSFAFCASHVHGNRQVYTTLDHVRADIGRTGQASPGQARYGLASVRVGQGVEDDVGYE